MLRSRRLPGVSAVQQRHGGRGEGPPDEFGMPLVARQDHAVRIRQGQDAGGDEGRAVPLHALQRLFQPAELERRDQRAAAGRRIGGDGQVEGQDPVRAAGGPGIAAGAEAGGGAGGGDPVGLGILRREVGVGGAGDPPGRIDQGDEGIARRMPPQPGQLAVAARLQPPAPPGSRSRRPAGCGRPGRCRRDCRRGAGPAGWSGRRAAPCAPTTGSRRWRPACARIGSSEVAMIEDEPGREPHAAGAAAASRQPWPGRAAAASLVVGGGGLAHGGTSSPG